MDPKDVDGSSQRVDQFSLFTSCAASPFKVGGRAAANPCLHVHRRCGWSVLNPHHRQFPRASARRHDLQHRHPTTPYSSRTRNNAWRSRSSGRKYAPTRAITTLIDFRRRWTTMARAMADILRRRDGPRSQHDGGLKVGSRRPICGAGPQGSFSIPTLIVLCVFRRASALLSTHPMLEDCGASAECRVDTFSLHAGRRPAAPALLESMAWTHVSIFFFRVTLSHGRAMRRVFRKGFAPKVARTSVLKHYGLNDLALLTSSRLPGPTYGENAARTCRAGGARSGFEVWLAHLRPCALAGFVSPWATAEWDLARNFRSAVLRAFEQHLAHRRNACAPAGWADHDRCPLARSALSTQQTQTNNGLVLKYIYGSSCYWHLSLICHAGVVNASNRR